MPTRGQISCSESNRDTKEAHTVMLHDKKFELPHWAPLVPNSSQVVGIVGFMYWASSSRDSAWPAGKAIGRTLLYLIHRAGGVAGGRAARANALWRVQGALTGPVSTKEFFFAANRRTL